MYLPLDDVVLDSNKFKAHRRAICETKTTTTTTTTPDSAPRQGSGGGFAASHDAGSHTTATP